MIRATTIGVLKNYRYGLNKSFTKQNDARTTMLTHRNFNSFAEDPSAAALSFQLRHARMTAESQKTVCDTSLRRFETAWASLETVVNKVDNVRKNSIKEADLTALNDPVGDARRALGKELDILADTLVQVMNNRYGDNFLFSGADGQTVPFSWGEDGELLYRGIPVDAAVPEVAMDNGAPRPVDKDGNLDPTGQYYIQSDSISTMKAADFDAMDAADQPRVMKGADGNPVRVDENGNFDPAGEYVMVTTNIKTMSKEDYDKEAANAEKLRYLSEDEKLYMDIGLGNKEDENDKLISSTAFDSTLQGISFLGFGKDADGDPKNIVSLVKKMANLCNSDYDGPLKTEDYNELFRLVGKTEDASSVIHDQHTAMDARSSKLKNNLELLDDNIYTLTEQYAEIEDVVDADAISAFLWASYSYNAALRVGNSVLSQSLMDYMQ